MCCFVCHANRCMRFASAAAHNTGAWIQAHPWFDSSVPSLLLPLPCWGNCFPQEMASLSWLRRCRNRLKLVFCKGDFPNLSIKGGTPLFRSIILRYFPVLRIGKMHLFIRITGDGSRKSGSSNIWSMGCDYNQKLFSKGHRILVLGNYVCVRREEGARLPGNTNNLFFNYINKKIFSSWYLKFVKIKKL